MEWEKFKETLEMTHEFPTKYTFKFVVKKESRSLLLELLELEEFIEKDSAKGNYLSLSFSITAISSDCIINVYQKASTIKGIILL